MITKPTDRIVWELERLPLNGRIGHFVAVLGRMGMTTPVRADFLGRTGRLWVILGTLVLAGGLGVWTWFSAFARPRLDVTTVPAEARVFIDGEPLGDRPRSAIVVRPGRHTLSVTMPGYLRSDQTIDVRAIGTLRKRVELEPSPNTGFALTSQPRGMLVWLDGELVRGDSGPVPTDFSMARVAPGRHVLELRGDPGIWPWRQVVTIEPDQFKKIHAVMQASSESHGCF
jgi:hypothetical protein